MTFDQYVRNWNALGKGDPMWAVLTSRRRGTWTEDEFFATGRADIDRLFARLAALGIESRTGRALDFGCGAGRLTQALAARFDQVDGVDISTSMVEVARRLNRFGERCHYHVNEAPDLRLLPSHSFDLVHSVIVLQHMEPSFALRYLGEFARVAKPGGLLAFQVPERYSRSPAGTLRALTPPPVRRLVWRLRYGHPIEMHCIPRATVESTLEQAGARLLEAFADHSAGPAYRSFFYFAQRVS